MTDFDAIPTDVVKIAKRTLLDCVGVGLAARNDPTTLAVRDLVLETGGKEESTLLGSRTKVPASEAALANGVASHALDFDDVSHVMMGHPSVVTYPASLAVGDRKSSSGREVLLSYIIGVEVACRLGAALTEKQYENGWHNTGTMGTFGAAAGAAKLLGLGVEETTSAIGIAASMCAGIKKNFGTSCKPYQAGQASSNGVKAALLAQRGFTSSPDVFEGKGSIVQLLSGALRDEEITRIGKPFVFSDPGIAVKLYPSCAFTHSSIDCTLDLINQHNISSTDVTRVECGVAQATIDTVRYGIAENGLQGKFSMPFCLSIALLDRRVQLNQFTYDKCHDEKVVEMEKRVKVYCDQELNSIRYTYNGARVKIVLRDGKGLYAETTRPKGDPAQSVGDEVLFEKFMSCASTTLDKESAILLRTKVMDIENIANINELSSLLTAA